MMDVKEMVRQMCEDYQALDRFKKAFLNLLKRDLDTAKIDFDCYCVEGSHDICVTIPEKTAGTPFQLYIHVGFSDDFFECNITPDIKKLFGKSLMRIFKNRIFKFALRAGFDKKKIKITEL